MLAIDRSIKQYIPATNERPIIYAEVVNAGVRIKSLDVDTTRGLIYWTDSAEARIYRSVSTVFGICACFCHKSQLHVVSAFS